MRSLTAAELLALDYKEVTVGNLRVGLPGIFTSLTDFVSRAGRGHGAASLLTDFMAVHDVDVIVGLTRAPKDSKGGKGLLMISRPGER